MGGRASLERADAVLADAMTEQGPSAVRAFGLLCEVYRVLAGGHSVEAAGEA